MKLADLHVFRTVVREGGITRAASALHRVPSNVSTRIQGLETDLGVALFVREGKRLQLSPKGKVLLDYADRLLTLADEARDAVHDQTPRGVLSLGAMESTAATRLPALLARLHQHHPGLSVELRTGAPFHLTALVLSGELDAAMVAEPVSDPRLESIVAYAETMVIIGPRGHRPIHSARDMERAHLLAFEPGCPHRQRLEAWCADDHVAPLKIIELGSYHAILGCCIAGMGVALVPAAVLDTYSERSHLSEHPVRAQWGKVNTMLIWRMDSAQGRVQALAKLM
jgi:DNA-binding transcriptional LysR family regulator